MGRKRFPPQEKAHFKSFANCYLSPRLKSIKVG